MAEYPSQPRFTFDTATVHMEIDIISPRREVALAIPLSDWEGFARRINLLKPDLRPWSIAYSIFFGIGVTAGLSIAPLVISGVASWLVTVYVAICSGALAAGVGLVISERMLSKQETRQVTLLVKEMTQTQDQYLESRVVQ